MVIRFFKLIYYKLLVQRTKHYTARELMEMPRKKRERIVNAQFTLWTLEDNDDYEVLEANEIYDE